MNSDILKGGHVPQVVSVLVVNELGRPAHNGQLLNPTLLAWVITQIVLAEMNSVYIEVHIVILCRVEAHKSFGVGMLQEKGPSLGKYPQERRRRGPLPATIVLTSNNDEPRLYSHGTDALAQLEWQPGEG